MSDLVDDLKIKNDALAMIAGGSIMSAEDDTDLAAQVAAVYDARIESLLSIYEWKFAGKIYKLDRIAETVDNDYVTADGKFMNGWRHGFALPGTALGAPRKVLANPRNPDDPFRNFFIEQNVLYADREDLWASVTVMASPAVWSPAFRLAATTILAADLCVPVTHDTTLAAQLLAKGEGSPQEGGRGGLLGRAIGVDAAGGSGKSPLWRDPLSDARLR